MRQQPVTFSRRSAPPPMLLGQARAGLAAPPSHQVGAADATAAVLTHAVCEQVIPRLLAANRAGTAACGAEAIHAFPSEAELTALMLDGTAEELDGLVAGLPQDAMGQEAFLLGPVTDTARALGRMWEEDTASFSDVTAGMARLGAVLRALGEPWAAAMETVPPSALLAPVPGEQHGFGVTLLARFFRRGGFQVTAVPGAARGELAALVAARSYDIVGLSVACTDRLATLPGEIGVLRRASRNRHLRVMVGGPAFALRPDVGPRAVGADATAPDAEAAVRRARDLLAPDGQDR